jgi:hypothetical protein
LAAVVDSPRPYGDSPIEWPVRLGQRPVVGFGVKLDSEAKQSIAGVARKAGPEELPNESGASSRPRRDSRDFLIE